jgi:putative ABC transport system ATP-binding protein
MTKLLIMLNMEERRYHLPEELSGGQKQRVAIGRAYAHKPALILADEPTGNLDHANSTEIMELLRSTAKKMEQTLIVVTHDPDIAAMADRIITISDGKIVSDQVLQKTDAAIPAAPEE